jgi:FHA domain-containing protein
MKWTDLDRHLRTNGCMLVRDRGKHSVWRSSTGALSTVPRHREIPRAPSGPFVATLAFRSRGRRPIVAGVDARIWVSAGGAAPRSVALGGERTVVGRSPDADLTLDDEAVSWNHLEIERRGQVLMAADLDSRNGTALNGEPLDRPRRLRDGDTLIVGGHRLEVSTAGSPTPVAATVAAAEPGVALNEEGAFAGRPATRAEIAAELHVSERTAQRRLDALAAKLEVAGDAGRDRPRQIAARVIELGLDRR